MPSANSAAAGESATRERGPIYRCEDVEINPSLGCLKRGGLEQHLRHQSFHLLLYMIEQRQRLISKEELIENFWQDAAVTDNAIVQCVKEIRKALGDDPREPRFIRTIHKIGYRFIASVTEEPSAAEPGRPGLEIDGTGPPLEGKAAGPEAVPAGPETKAAVADAAKSGRYTRLKRWLRWIVLGLAATAGIVPAWTVLRRSTVPGTEVTLPRVPGARRLPSCTSGIGSPSGSELLSEA